MGPLSPRDQLEVGSDMVGVVLRDTTFTLIHTLAEEGGVLESWMSLRGETTK
jgi:hypothetical protein